MHDDTSALATAYPFLVLFLWIVSPGLTHDTPGVFFMGSGLERNTATKAEDNISRRQCRREKPFYKIVGSLLSALST